MKNCMDAIVDWMINCNVIDESEKELYQYAVHSFLLSLAPLLLAGGIGFCMGNVWQGIFIVIPFIFLRKFSGGYHAKNVWICLVVSCLLLFLCIMLSTYVKCDEVLIMLTFLAVIILSVFSPIENENKVLNQEEKNIYKKKVIFYALVFLIIDTIFIFVGWDFYARCFSIGIQLSAALQIPCIIKK